MKIGILTCLKSNDVCTRAGCLNGFNNRTDFFRDYDDTVTLGAMMTCNGCGDFNPAEPEDDPGIAEKIARLVLEKIEIVHCGVCRMQAGVECERFGKICSMIEKTGIKVVKGTHRE